MGQNKKMKQIKFMIKNILCDLKIMQVCYFNQKFNEKNQEVNFKNLTQFFALPEKKKINPNIDPNEYKPKKKPMTAKNKGFNNKGPAF